jgi:hypothetical protein
MHGYFISLKTLLSFMPVARQFEFYGNKTTSFKTRKEL